MKKFVIFALGLGTLAACGGGNGGDEVDTMVEQHRIMVENACKMQGQSEPSCKCISNVMKDQLDTPLFLSAANTIGKGGSPAQWLETVPEDEREGARAALVLARECNNLPE